MHAALSIAILKPENVLVADGAPEHDCIRVVDFGLAKLGGREQADITQTGEIFGTPVYMSPEQLRGSRSVTAATDLYAVGIMMYELLEGRAPFQGSTSLEIGMKHLTEAAPPVTADCPPALRDLVAALLHKDPAARPPGAEALANELRWIAHPHSRPPRAHETSTRPLALVAASMVIAALLTALFVVFGNDAPRETPSSLAAERKVNPLIVGHSPREDASGGVDLGIDAHEIADTSAPAPARTGEFKWDSTFSVVVPTNYEPQRAVPLVVFLHESAQNVRKDTGFPQLAERKGFLFAYAHTSHVRAWEKPDLDALRSLLATLQESYSIDADRIFAVGHVTGGELAERLLCGNFPEFDAIATTSTRSKVDQELCTVAIPYLHLAPMKDGYTPIEGGESCSGVNKISLAAHESDWRKINGCAGPKRDLKHYKTTKCMTWQCKTPFEVCHLDGGHNWPKGGKRPLDALFLKCDGEAADFPFEERIWEFFERQSPARVGEETADPTPTP